MGPNLLYLFRDVRFLPIFVVQFCGCVNDNVMKNALIMLITYQLSSQLVLSASLMVLAANTIFVLPFVLFASLAGQLADRYERSMLVKVIKLLELFIAIFAAYGFRGNNLGILFVSIFLMGIHSTFFGPIKYSVLPDHLHKDELLGANGFVEAGTFFSILVGTIIGGYYTINGNLIIMVLIIIATIGLISSLFMPRSGNSNPKIKINFNLYQESMEMLKYAKTKKQIYLAILGISWFWFISAAIFSQIPALAKETLGADENVANLFLATFSIGVGVGSFLCSKILENEITTKYIFLAAIGISIFGIDLFFASRIGMIQYEPEQLRSILVFLSKKHNWRIIIDLFFISAIGGVYIVPLYAVLQYFSSFAHRSRIIAINHFINSIFMAGSTLILSLLFYWGYSIPFVILFISILNIVVAYYIYELIPEVKIIPFPVVRGILKVIFDFMYNVEVKGIENFYKAGKRSVIIANHISYLDPAVLATYLPEEMTFAINTTIAKAWWVRPFLKVNRTLPVDPTSAMAIKTLIKEVQKDKKIAIFPEGRISITGSLMKVYEGPGMIAEKAGATILPVRIDGTQFTHFSKLKNILKTRIFPKITVTILPPVQFASRQDIQNMDNRAKRKYMGQALYDIMVDMMFESSNYKNTLFQSLIESAKVHGFKKQIIQDVDYQGITYQQLLLDSFTLAYLMKREAKSANYLGLMLPNMIKVVSTFYAMQALGSTVVMLDYTSEVGHIITACQTTSVNIIYTSKEFIEKARLQETIIKILAANINIIYLEDLQQRISWGIRIKLLLYNLFPQSYYNSICTNHRDQGAAVVVFTSDCLAAQKAIVLSHRNLQANRFQLGAKLQFSPEDLAFIALPFSDCFGLTSTIMMILNGVPTFLYLSAQHYRNIPEVIYDIGATIIFSVDIFLDNYALYAHPYDFYSIRYVLAYGGTLREQTRQVWLNKFGIRIFEMYGTAEMSSVIACNTPMHYRSGSVGRLVPQVEYYIKQVEGIEGAGQLFVKGPNIMLGYMFNNNPGVLHYTASELGLGWLDTQEVVKCDQDGYIMVLGKLEQFIMIEEKKIPLLLIEQLANIIDKDSANAVIHLENVNREKKIILFTTSVAINNAKFIEILHNNLLPLAYLPEIINVQEIPRISKGKVNYKQLENIYRKSG
ncbi:acyl-[ACP]--phospholipid O-acyltransferase [Candidatus Tisiphia endosymbiont of Nemotelus uliginosus]|uniref:acyl-[ACP]--phospholipid O-acyltransferase n=1 Tax=Candidatus Tisiphia endosymbiont of Nemotelus uliginosus TaxID=3077926 RepID=UPI0035C880FD